MPFCIISSDCRNSFRLYRAERILSRLPLSAPIHWPLLEPDWLKNKPRKPHFGVELAREAIADVHSTRQIWIAGSIAPLLIAMSRNPHPILILHFESIAREPSGWRKRGWFRSPGNMNNLNEAKRRLLRLLNRLPVFTSFILAETALIERGKYLFSDRRNQDARSRGLGINCTHHSLISNFPWKLYEELDCR
jgi:hypothetical protein